MCVCVCETEREREGKIDSVMSFQAGGGVGGCFFPKVLIKEGRCIKMLQISAASPVELALPQVVRANILYLLCLFVSAYLHAPAAFTWWGGRGGGEGEGCRFVADNNRNGIGRDQTLLFLL